MPPFHARKARRTATTGIKKHARNIIQTRFKHLSDCKVTAFPRFSIMFCRIFRSRQPSSRRPGRMAAALTNPQFLQILRFETARFMSRNGQFRAAKQAISHNETGRFTRTSGLRPTFRKTVAKTGNIITDCNQRSSAGQRRRSGVIKEKNAMAVATNLAYHAALPHFS